MFRHCALFVIILQTVFCQDLWAYQQEGCLKVGFTRTVNIPDCVQFPITTNACRGVCRSFAVPSVGGGLVEVGAQQLVTSVGQCCNIMAAVDLAVEVNCVGGPRSLVFKSATKCACYQCKKQ